MFELARESAWFSRAAVFLVAAVLLTAFGLGGTAAGDLLAPLFGPRDPAVEAGFGRDLTVGILLAAAFVLNLEFIRLLLFRYQVLVIWGELLALFYGFVLSFDRDFGVIFEVGRSGVSNLYFLITTGAFTTIYVSLIAIAIACVLALAGALGKLSSNGAAYAIATFYISFFRGTPLLLQVVLIYTGFAQLGFVLEAVPAGITALSLCYGAYMAEIFRAGIEGVPQGQREAAGSHAVEQVGRGSVENRGPAAVGHGKRQVRHVPHVDPGGCERVAAIFESDRWRRHDQGHFDIFAGEMADQVPYRPFEAAEAMHRHGGPSHDGHSQPRRHEGTLADPSS